jgi:hypothetical protein
VGTGSSRGRRFYSQKSKIQAKDKSRGALQRQPAIHFKGATFKFDYRPWTGSGKFRLSGAPPLSLAF